MTAEHISDHDLDRYYLGMVTDEEELARLEEHLLWCAFCVDGAEQTQNCVDVIRAALLQRSRNRPYWQCMWTPAC